MDLRSRSERRVADGNGAADAALLADDPYDDRHRQTKALARFERQKVAWERMQKHLMSVTAPASSRITKGTAATSRGSRELAHTMGSSVPNMVIATAAARLKAEDDTLLHVATAASHRGDGSHAWEGLLRSTNEQGTRRLVPIGRTCQPYPLYGEVHDPSTLPDDHLAFARVVSEEDAMEASNGLESRSQPFAQSTLSGGGTWSGGSSKLMREHTVAKQRVKAALTNTTTTKAAPKDLFIDEAASLPHTAAAYEDAEKELSPSSYYEEQLRRFAPYVQNRLGHFLQPRTFLHVEGHPAPHATPEDETRLRETAAAAAADGEDDAPGSVPPVEYFPPPPQPPQTQLWTSSAFASRLPSRNSANSAAAAAAVSAAGAALSVHSAATSARRADQRSSMGENDDGEDERELPRDSIATAQPHYTESSTTDGDHHNDTQRSQPPSPLHPMRVQEKVTSVQADKGNNALTLEPQDGPAMELSTRSLLFRTCPRELLQGSATLRNTGTTTIYYSWAVVDAMQEHLRELYEAEHEAEKDEEEVAAAGGEQSDRRSETKRHRQPKVKPDTALPYASLSLTHQLAAHQHNARESFFFMSAPMNGVVLPGEEVIFPFSVRATREGVFQSTYELLTVPPAPERVFVRLRALVQRDGPTLEWLARPVAAALEAKVAVDAQRRLVQHLSSNTRAIAASALHDRVAALDGAVEVAKRAEKATRRAQAEAWHSANRMTFDRIPYHAAVYDKLAKLSAVVRETYVLLSKGDDKTGRAKAAPQPPQPKEKETASGGAAESRVVDTPQNQGTAPAAVVTILSPAPKDPQAPPPPQLQQQQQPLPPPSEEETLSLTTIQWDGALLPLLYQIMHIRDNATRQVFLEAVQVLLRAARAASDVKAANKPGTGSGAVRGNQHGDPTTVSGREEENNEGGDDAEEEEVPLTMLLQRAAAALADAVVSRQQTIVEKQCEGFSAQPVKPAAALSLSPAPPCESGTTSGTGKGRATSSSAQSGSGGSSAGNRAAKKNAAAPGSARGATADSRENKNAASAADGGAGSTAAPPTITAAQRLLMSAIPAAALEGFSVTQANAETARLWRAAEKGVGQARMEGELAAAKKAFTELLTALFREVIDAACDRTPLATCTATRLAELREVQQSTPLVVDMSVDPLVAPPVGKTSKRK
ncbi:hypothetical protein ABB37_02154 [Leptomonas pyrrhocoris]|uniref:MYCBP-associated protein n=1 Tax=Leptomonas pyrrhocoris TaxID=157538 RepID=A0A0M9G7K9_LEPPY|nr:hypothetical protein ABB37_02154 [Leptomonas pyrrhocoris]XP_015662458.1 hypothetical protein ABB37_02154 [Leptomonas pyrrhocoris]KPA84018.1 hypothetical protein ABB37_02154 [Leptomonas pyrrhocoris]KPA84019.1 hypothetical protein ABB37_02154 [Leptomonas pyrrhocoris]|eukprot:XP_015662457.1 hypothetical protein ABB37_02154 [Leptomonas pyrrhocoris]